VSRGTPVEALASVPRPIVAVGSQLNRDPASPGHFLYQAAAWLAHQAGTDLVEFPGGHAPYFTDPAALAEHLRPLLQDLT
jgi:hypothetical protein